MTERILRSRFPEHALSGTPAAGSMRRSQLHFSYQTTRIPTWTYPTITKRMEDEPSGQVGEKYRKLRRFPLLLARTWCVQNAFKKTQAGEEGGVSNGAKRICVGRVETPLKVHAKWLKVLRWAQRNTLAQLHSKNMRTDRDVKIMAYFQHLYFNFFCKVWFKHIFGIIIRDSDSYLFIVI